MSSVADARRLLGVDAEAGVAAVHIARRRLAKQLHPDVDGGDVGAMQRLNQAAELVLRDIAERVGTPLPGPPSSPPAPRPGAESSGSRGGGGGPRVDHDVASFVVEALPVDAFEALVVVASWIGEVLVDEPPYQLDVALTDPLRCWCRLGLVPDAGASTVSVTIAAFPDEALPDIDAVRDLWVSVLNQLGARGDA